METLEGGLANHAEDYQRAGDLFSELLGRWETAAEELEGDSDTRRRAESVRRVISRVELEFEATGLKSPTSRLKSLKFVPQVGDTVEITAKHPNGGLDCTGAVPPSLPTSAPPPRTPV